MNIRVNTQDLLKTNDTVHTSLASAYPPSSCLFTHHFLWKMVIPGLFAHH